MTLHQIQKSDLVCPYLIISCSIFIERDLGKSKEFLPQFNTIIFRGNQSEPGTWSELKVSLERAAQGYETI